MSFLNVEGKTYLITGIANKRSVAYHTTKILQEEGATCLFSVRSPAEKRQAARLVNENDIFLCDVQKDDEIANLAKEIGGRVEKIDGLLHSIAFANYSEGIKPIYEAKRADFLQAADISCFSLIALAGAFKDLFDDDASVVAMSISDTFLATKNYGYMGTIKAALDSAVAYLSQSFAEHSRVRFNTVKAGPLRTASSAGIPGFLENYLYTEMMTLRKENLKTEEVGRLVAFMLSPASSGMTAGGVMIDAGLRVNQYDPTIQAKVLEDTIRRPKATKDESAS